MNAAYALEITVKAADGVLHERLKGMIDKIERAAAQGLRRAYVDLYLEDIESRWWRLDRLVGQGALLRDWAVSRGYTVTWNTYSGLVLSW